MNEVKQFLKTYRTLIIGFVIGLVGLNGCSSYNTMAKLNEGVNSKWSQVENAYQRRSDLIPNLVEVVKGYAEHEKQTLTAVIEARAKATSITIDASKLDENSIQQFDAAQNGITQALSKLMMVTEQYPNLKANETYQQLMTELTGTENRIAVARNDFNTGVGDYNLAVRTFPAVIFAKIFGFAEKLFQYISAVFASILPSKTIIRYFSV
jgi:LemA protein